MKLKLKYLSWIFTLSLTGFQILSGFELDRFQNERLQYDLIYKGLNVASSEMWLEINDSTQHIIWTVESKPFVNLLFPVNNRYETILDNAGVLLAANKFIEQKNIQQEWLVKYDWQALRALTNDTVEWPVLSNATNILALLYDVRMRESFNDSLFYLIDVESQLWKLGSVPEPLYHPDTGQLNGHELVFTFIPAAPIEPRAWNTDLLTNRLARENSQLLFRLGPPPLRQPRLIRFGGEGEEIEMRLKPQVRRD